MEDRWVNERRSNETLNIERKEKIRRMGGKRERENNSNVARWNI